MKKFNLTFPIENESQYNEVKKIAESNGIDADYYDDAYNEYPRYVEFYGITQPMVYMIMNIINNN